VSQRLLVMEVAVRGRDETGLFFEAALVEGKPPAPDAVGLAFSRCLAHELGRLEGWAVIGTGTPIVIVETQGKRRRGRGIPPVAIAREALVKAAASHLLSGVLELSRDWALLVGLQTKEDEGPQVRHLRVEGPDLASLLTRAADEVRDMLGATDDGGPRATPPRDLESLRLLGRALLADGDARRTARLLDSVLAESPRCGPALFARARARLEAGDVPGLLADVEPLSIVAPNDPATRALYGYGLLRSARLPEARSHLVTANELAPTAPALAWLGIAQDALGDQAAAETSFSGAHELAPHDPAILHDRAVLRIKLGRFTDARLDLEKAISLDPRSAERAQEALSTALRGEAAAWAQDPAADHATIQRASSQLALVVARAPEDPVAWFLLGIARKRLSEMPEAVAAFQHAARLDAKWHYPHLELAAVAATASRIPDAIAHAREALRLAPDDALVLGNLGALLLIAQALDEAEPLLRRALELAPKNELAQKALDELERIQRTKKAQLRHLERGNS
jgi:Flp pilus assembly protein TadD